jgi:hypothetical protein
MRKFDPNKDSMISLSRERAALLRSITALSSGLTPEAESMTWALMNKLAEVERVHKELEVAAHSGTPVLICGRR